MPAPHTGLAGQTSRVGSTGALRAPEVEGCLPERDSQRRLLLRVGGTEVPQQQDSMGGADWLGAGAGRGATQSRTNLCS